MAQVTGPVVIDAGVLIGLLDPADAHHTWSVQLLRSLGPGRMIVNAITLAEALVHPAIAGVAPVALTTITRLGPRIVSVSESDVLDLAQLRAASGLRMPDALVVHTAAREAAAVATTDQRLAREVSAVGLVAHQP